jgi:hypothetical protein
LELAFESQALRTICEDEDRAREELDPTVAEMLKHRLADLRAAKTPKDLLVGHPRVGDDSGWMVVDLAGDSRIVFKANHVKNPVGKDGELDWSRVSRIKILRIEGGHAK